MAGIAPPRALPLAWQPYRTLGTMLRQRPPDRPVTARITRFVNAAADVIATPPPPPLPPAPAPVSAPHVGEAIGLLALYFGLQLAVGFVATIAVGFCIGLRTGLHHAAGAGANHLGNALQAALSDPDLRTGITAATLMIVASLTLWLIHRRWPRQWHQPLAWRGFGFGSPSSAAFYGAAVALGLAAPIFGGLLTQWLAHGHSVPQSIATMGQTASPGVRLWLALGAVTLGPLVEEALFRGVLLSALLGFRRNAAAAAPAGNVRVGMAIAVSAALFGLVHLPDLGFLWYAVPDLALLGAGAAWLRLQSGSLWPAVLAHSTNNLLAVAGWFVVAHSAG